MSYKNSFLFSIQTTSFNWVGLTSPFPAINLVAWQIGDDTYITVTGSASTISDALLTLPNVAGHYPAWLINAQNVIVTSTSQYNCSFLYSASANSFMFLFGTAGGAAPSFQTIIPGASFAQAGLWTDQGSSLSFSKYGRIVVCQYRIGVTNVSGAAEALSAVGSGFNDATINTWIPLGGVLAPAVAQLGPTGPTFAPGFFLLTQQTSPACNLSFGGTVTTVVNNGTVVLGGPSTTGVFSWMSPV
jgi:hypothetical protein